MKLLRNIVAASLLVMAQAGFSQGFINLDFESARIITDPSLPYYPYSVASTNAIPGWTAYIDGTPQSYIEYNDLALGAAWVSIHDTNDLIHWWGGFYGGIIQGRYSVLLQPSKPNPTSIASIGQTGTVPLTAMSVWFDANGPVSLFFAGQPIPLFASEMGSNYTLYAGNISAFAGQTGELLFLANAISPSGWGTVLDDISFSSQVVPEPSELALAALGTLLFAFRHRCKGASPPY